MSDTPMGRIVGKWPGVETDEEINEALEQFGKCQKCRKLEDLLRWRKWPEEKPEKDGDYLCADSGRIFVAGFADGFWAEDYGTDELLAKVQYWRPIGPLPEGDR